MEPLTLPGVHRVHDGGAALRALAAAGGWEVVAFSATTRREVLHDLGRVLDFPAYYGQNLDAAWDCLTDLERPVLVVWSGWDALAIADPEGWAAVLGLFRDRTSEQPGFAVALV